MNKHIHIRDFDAGLHEKLVARARERNMSLSHYLRAELSGIACQNSWVDFANKTKGLQPVELPQTSADVIREIREEA